MVRAAAAFSLATVVHGDGESRQSEAEKLYREFIQQFDGSVHYTEDGQWYGYAGIEKDRNRAAKMQLDELTTRAMGMPAPEINGLDLDGHPMKLAEYRGRVVLLIFWATWCGPCMEMIPDEQALLKHFVHHPFAIVGIDVDEEDGKSQIAVKDHGISWRSFRNSLRGGQMISKDWSVIGFPTLYLIDEKGAIRQRWIGGPPRDELIEAIDRALNVPRNKATAN